MNIDKNRITLRMQLVQAAMEGVIHISMRRSNGSVFKFPATLLPTSMECATLNGDEYYKSIGTTRAKHQREKKLAALKEKALTWQEKVERSINLFYIVDAEEFKWRCVSLNSLVGFDVD